MRNAPELSTIAAGSPRSTGAGGGGASRRRVVKNTAATTPTAMTSTTRRARFCQVIIFSRGRCPACSATLPQRVHEAPRRSRSTVASHVAHRELQVFIALISIVFERKREIQRAAILGDELLALDRPPGDRAKDAPVLLQGHLQVLVLQPARAVDDFHAPRLEQRPRIAHAERREHRHLAGEIGVDVAKAQAPVDSQPRLQIVRAQQVIGIVRDRLAKRRHVRRRHRQAGGLFVPAETVRCAALCSSAASTLNPRMLRHEPCASSPSMDMTMAGR